MSFARTVMLATSAAVLVAGGYMLGSLNRAPDVSPARNDSASPRYEAQVADAYRRWAKEGGLSEEDARAQWPSARTMFIPTRDQGSGVNCIELVLERGGVGVIPFTATEGRPLS
ncbi:hypothetical protein G7077_05605 [Sphingomonas piscis]|uniref:Uncharacterized protein n=1 Tax=Sphingomonas piscis TaxID=2714943 RepID=A0A6G7YNY4_9SPHN|nr:hypothetical protein [Sphingomonas piscis]QIK78453.1 hypothetical protein G7077_05605 [Sphingomonas piscis]